jgi:L-fuconolactonase
MKIIDTHCHASRIWYEPLDGLLHQMDQNQVEQAVLIQIFNEYDNAYNFECVRQHPDRLCVVALVDVNRATAGDELERLAEQGAKGVRLRADWRSPGDDPLAIWRAALRMGLLVSCMGTPAEFAASEFAELVQTLPDLPIIIEHLGSGSQPDGESAPYPIRQQVFDLARFPNVSIKVPGLGEFCQRAFPLDSEFPFERANLQLLDRAYAAFGPDRMMWGSDYPPVSNREGYRNALHYPLNYFSTHHAADCPAIFGGTAARVFDLK